MVTRRDILGGAAAAGTLIHARLGFAKAVQTMTKVNFAVPAGACDRSSRGQTTKDYYGLIYFN